MNRLFGRILHLVSVVEIHGFQSQFWAVAWGIVTFAKQLMEERIFKKNRSTNFCKNPKQQQIENIKKNTTCDKKWNDMFLLLIEVFFLSRLGSHQDVKQDVLVGGFKYCFISHSYSGKWSNWLIFGRFPIWLAHFSTGLVKNHQQTFCLLGLPGWCSPSVHHLRSIRCCTDWKTWKMSVRRLPKESW